MRDAIIIIVILALIVSGDILTKKYLNPETDELIERLKILKEKTIEAKQTSNRKEISEQIEDIDKEWNEHLEICATIVMHQELDNIAQPLTRAKINISDGQLEDALQDIETTIFYLNHIKEREMISLKNIF